MQVFQRPVDILVGPGVFELDEVVKRVSPMKPGDLMYVKGASRILSTKPGNDRVRRQLAEGEREKYGLAADCALHIKGSRTAEGTSFTGGTLTSSRHGPVHDLILQDIKLNGNGAHNGNLLSFDHTFSNEEAPAPVIAMYRCEVMNAKQEDAVSLWNSRVILVDCDIHDNETTSLSICGSEKTFSFIQNLRIHHSNQRYGESSIYFSEGNHHFYGNNTRISSTRAAAGIFVNHGARVYFHSLQPSVVFEDVRGDNVELGTFRKRACEFHHVE
jgi:hypothetical protein